MTLKGVMEQHPCPYNWRTTKHADGTLHQVCGTCKEERPILISGYEAGDCSDAVTIMPMRPLFWAPAKEAEWFRNYIASEEAAGRTVSPEARAMAA